MEQKENKYCFGLVKVGTKGQIVIPAKARKVFGIKEGNELLILGDEEKGLAIVRPELSTEIFNQIMGKVGK